MGLIALIRRCETLLDSVQSRFEKTSRSLNRLRLAGARATLQLLEQQKPFFVDFVLLLRKKSAVPHEEVEEAGNQRIGCYAGRLCVVCHVVAPTTRKEEKMSFTEDVRYQQDRQIAEGRALWRVLDRAGTPSPSDVTLDLRLPTSAHGSPEQQAARRAEP